MSSANLPHRNSQRANAEGIYDQCHLKWGVESVITPAVHRADDQRSGFWYSTMSPEYLK
jgi:hypothetical protein